MNNRITLKSQEWLFFLSEEEPPMPVVFSDTIPLPSTVQMERKSPRREEKSDGYLNDPYRFEGYAVYERTVELEPESGRELFLVLERTRTTRLWVNGSYVGTQNSLCTPHRYAVTDAVRAGENRITIMVDNVTCPVPGGHMTSPDTQTNWLGITGDIYLESVPRVRYEKLRVYPDVSGSSIRVEGSLAGGDRLTVRVSVTAQEGCTAWPEKEITLTPEKQAFDFDMPGAKPWDEHHRTLYNLHVRTGDSEEQVRFGMRVFAARGTELLLNGEKIWLRGRHQGLLFPLTGAAPTDKESWLRDMETAKAYGINHYRCHTCCPPEAAFEAADELGIYLEPELPFWGTVEEEITEGQKYLIEEGYRILDSFGNHPSFFALSLGNELWGSKERLNRILGDYKAHDSRPLYTQGSNNFQFVPCTVENDDFFVGVRFSKERLFRGSYAMCDAPLGHIQTMAPNADYTYDAHIRPEKPGEDRRAGGTIEIQYGTGVKKVEASGDSGEFIPEIPVVSHEIGQYFIYPDYNEISHYTGVLKPYNLEIFRDRLESAGLLAKADAYFRASGSFAVDCYKRELETALRTKELSGFQLLDLQDFTGQGTALVGVLNSLMESKGLVTAEAWREFCDARVLLGCLPKFVFRAGEAVTMPVKLYQYGPEPDVDPAVEVSLTVGDRTERQRLQASGSYSHGLFDLGSVSLRLPEGDRPRRAELTIRGMGLANHYTLWIYPEQNVPDTLPEGLTVTGEWPVAKAALAAGESVLYLPDEISEEFSVPGTYCTDFWNYPMFRSISESMNRPVPVGTLGYLIDASHPAFADFPTETYSTAQWFDIAMNSRTLILDGTGIDPILRTMDNCQRNHNLGTIFEASAGGGRLLVCTARLRALRDSLPAQWLYRSLVNYASSDAFRPNREIDPEWLERAVGK